MKIDPGCESPFVNKLINLIAFTLQKNLVRTLSKMTMAPNLRKIGVHTLLKKDV